MKKMANNKEKGFTLLEVMVALFVVAIALGGVIKVMGSAAKNSARLSDRTFAQWVALNELAELRIKKAWPKLGEIKGDQEMVDRKWNWVQKTIKTEDVNVKRVELSVWALGTDSDADPVVTVVGFLAKQ
ncbi:MAG TPA: type II secretion system protein GspI [Leucothrix sp.]|nr:type II secretion system protein GspI [Leucothrix sp.]